MKNFPIWDDAFEHRFFFNNYFGELIEACVRGAFPDEILQYGQDLSVHRPISNFFCLLSVVKFGESASCGAMLSPL